MFKDYKVRAVIRALLRERLQGTQYDPVTAPKVGAPIYVGKRLFIGSSDALCMIRRDNFKKQCGAADRSGAGDRAAGSGASLGVLAAQADLSGERGNATRREFSET